MNRKYSVLAGCACSWFAIAGVVLAQTPSSGTGRASTYPAKVVRLVVPFSPGGATDIIGRLAAQKITEAWGQNMIIDNRPGASGMIGADIVAKAPPDGYTVLLGSTAEL